MFQNAQEIKTDKVHNIKRIVDITDIDMQQHKRKEEAKYSKHNDKVLEYYCNVCKCATCVACCVTSHFQHRYEGLNEVDGKFIERIKREIEEGAKDENFYMQRTTGCVRTDANRI